MKKKFELEYTIKSSVRILYQCLSTSSGLSDWFADDVTLKKDIAIFKWDDSSEEAKIISKKTDDHIRFQWVDDEDSECFFEFSIKTDPLTGDVALIITDFADPGEEDAQRRLWDTQVGELLHILGN